MNRRADHLLEKIAALERELANLREGYVIVDQRYRASLESLKLLTLKATEAARRSANAAVKSELAVKYCTIAAQDAADRKMLNVAEVAADAAEAAAASAAEAAAAATSASGAAASAVAQQAGDAEIRASAEASSAARRAIEAAAQAGMLSQAASALARALRTGAPRSGAVATS